MGFNPLDGASSADSTVEVSVQAHNMGFNPLDGASSADRMESQSFTCVLQVSIPLTGRPLPTGVTGLPSWMEYDRFNPLDGASSADSPASRQSGLAGTLFQSP